LTKRELVIEVAAKLRLTQNEVSTVVQETLDTITEVLVEGQRLEIRNFGVFEVKERDARIGRNPRTGEEVPIPKKRVAAFRPGKALKEWIQSGPDQKPHHLFREDAGDGHDAPSEDLAQPEQPVTVESTETPGEQAASGATPAPAASGEQQGQF